MPDDNAQLSSQDFAAKIRAKYPGAYDKVGDTELTNRILLKYPEYREKVQMQTPVPGAQFSMQGGKPTWAAGQPPQVQPTPAPAGLTDPSPYGAAKGGGFLPSKAAKEGTLSEYSQAASMPFIALGGASAVEAPIATGLGLAGSASLGAGAKYGAKKAGLGPVGQDVAETGGQILGGGIGFKGGSMLSNALPSAERAAVAMNAIKGGMKATEIPTFEASAEALRAKEIAAAGDTLPKPISGFLRRVMDPEKPRITLDEATDFYTNASKMTAKEWSEFKAPMQRQVALFTKALGQNIEESLNSAKPGQGTALRSAMDEYAAAKRLEGTSTKLFKVGGTQVAKGAAEVAGGMGIYQLIKSLGAK